MPTSSLPAHFSPPALRRDKDQLLLQQLRWAQSSTQTWKMCNADRHRRLAGAGLEVSGTGEPCWLSRSHPGLSAVTEGGEEHHLPCPTQPLGQAAQPASGSGGCGAESPARAGSGQRDSSRLVFSVSIKYAASLRKMQLLRITESQNGRGWKGPLWVI